MRKDKHRTDNDRTPSQGKQQEYKDIEWEDLYYRNHLTVDSDSDMVEHIGGSISNSSELNDSGDLAADSLEQEQEAEESIPESTTLVQKKTRETIFVYSINIFFNLLDSFLGGQFEFGQIVKLVAKSM